MCNKILKVRNLWVESCIHNFYFLLYKAVPNLLSNWFWTQTIFKNAIKPVFQLCFLFKFWLCPGVTVEERVDVYDIMFKQENGEYERYSFEFGPKL